MKLQPLVAPRCFVGRGTRIHLPPCSPTFFFFAGKLSGIDATLKACHRAAVCQAPPALTRIEPSHLDPSQGGCFPRSAPCPYAVSGSRTRSACLRQKTVHPSSARRR